MPHGADDRKLRELMLYIANRSIDDPWMGATKLNKVLFRCDFGAYLTLGESITGHPYFRLPQGPAPRYLLPVRDSLIKEGAVDLRAEDLGPDRKPLERLVPLREANTSVFTKEQLAFIDGVIEGAWMDTGTDMANETHLMVGWRVAAHKEVIPYETALIADRATPADIERGMDLARQHGWI